MILILYPTYTLISMFSNNLENQKCINMTGNSILLIDDEKVLLETISDDLKESGYEVTTAISGEEGLKKFQNASARSCDH